MSGSSRTLPTLVVVVLFVVSLSAAGLAVGDTTRGEPDIDVYLPNNEVSPGTETQFSFQVANDARVRSGTPVERITTARAVNVEVTDEGPFDVRTGRTSIGQIRDGTVSTADFDVTVPDDIEPGTHEIRVRVRYAVTNIVTDEFDQRLSRSERATIEVHVRDDARFEVTDVTTDAQPGTTGEAEIELENVGSQAAAMTRATITGGTGVTIDGEAAEAFLGTLEPGDSERIAVDVAVAESIGTGEKPVRIDLEYRDENGIERTKSLAEGLSPFDAQSVSIERLEDTLAVGYSGHIRGTVRNDGPTDVSDGVLVIEPVTDSLFVDERRFALPPLESGEATDFTFPTDVSGQADPGPRQVRFSVEYTNDGRTTATVGPVSERVVVDDRRNEFSITGEDTRITAGGTTELVLTVTNERPETLRNINAKLYTDSPLSSGSDEAFVNELEPGASGEIRFDISAAGGTMAKTHPVELDFQYDTERGETVLSRTYQHPVEVEAPVDDGGGGPGPLLVGLVLLVVAVGVGVWWRRRNR